MLKAVPKKKKAPSKTSITNKLDAVVSKIVRLRDKWCVCCGSTQDPQCGHYIGRRFKATRFDLTNCHRQCAGCNMRHNENHFPYTHFIQRTYGEKYPETLYALSREPAPGRFELLALLDTLTAELKRLEALQ
jgi:hypothetical protein